MELTNIKEGHRRNSGPSWVMTRARSRSRSARCFIFNLHRLEFLHDHVPTWACSLISLWCVYFPNFIFYLLLVMECGPLREPGPQKANPRWEMWCISLCISPLWDHLERQPLLPSQKCLNPLTQEICPAHRGRLYADYGGYWRIMLASDVVYFRGAWQYIACYRCCWKITRKAQNWSQCSDNQP